MKNILILILTFISIAYCHSQSSSNIERQIELEDLKKSTIKLENEIEELEDRLEIVQKVKTSLTNASFDSIKIKEEIEKIKKFNQNTNENVIIRSIISLYDLTYSSNSNFSRTLFQYSRNTETNTQEITYLLTLDKYSAENDMIDRLFTYDEKDKRHLSYKEFEEFKQQLSYKNLVEKFKTEQNRIQSAVDGQINTINSKVKDQNKKVKENQRKRLELKAKLESKSNYDKTIFQWGFPVFILFILLLYLIPLWFLYKGQSQNASNIESIYKMIYGSGLLTEIITVFLLTSTILLLGITDKLEPEVLGTLIGGISGYVLGKSFRNVRDGDD